MKILIDARLYGLHHRGIGRYLMELINGIITVDKINQYILLIDTAARQQFPPLPSNFILQEAPYRAYSLAEQILIPWLIIKIKPDLIHWPHFNAPYFCPRPFIITIHDLILHHAPSERASSLPGLIYWFKVIVYRLLIRRLLNKAKCIITVSHTVATDVKNFYPAVAKKIVTIYLAPSQLPNLKAIEQANPFLLTVGAAYPHKNLEQAIEGVALIRKQIPNLELYLVGRIDFFANRLKSVVKAKGYSDWVKFLGQVTDDELSGLYHNCQAYLFLSLQEGFGLGPLEAASNEALIIASDIPVLHEILTDGAIFTDPKNTQQIAQAIISSFIPATKEKTMAAARQTLKRYSWPDTVNKTLKVYHETIVR